MRTVIFLLAFASALFCGSIAAPVLVGFAFGEGSEVIQLSILASTGTFVASLVLAATLGYRHVLTPNRLILTMVVVWITMSLLGTTPFMLVSDMPFERLESRTRIAVRSPSAKSRIPREDRRRRRGPSRLGSMYMSTER